MERHELQDIHREAQDIQQTMRWEAFRSDSVYQITDCLEKGEDLVDLLNDLDLHFDEYDSLTNEQVNTLVIEAVKAMK